MDKFLRLAYLLDKHGLYRLASQLDIRLSQYGIDGVEETAGMMNMNPIGGIVEDVPEQDTPLTPTLNDGAFVQAMKEAVNRGMEVLKKTGVTTDIKKIYQQLIDSLYAYSFSKLNKNATSLPNIFNPAKTVERTKLANIKFEPFFEQYQLSKNPSFAPALQKLEMSLSTPPAKVSQPSQPSKVNPKENVPKGLFGANDPLPEEVADIPQRMSEDAKKARNFLKLFSNRVAFPQEIQEWIDGTNTASGRSLKEDIKLYTVAIKYLLNKGARTDVIAMWADSMLPKPTDMTSKDLVW